MPPVDVSLFNNPHYGKATFFTSTSRPWSGMVEAPPLDHGWSRAGHVGVARMLSRWSRQSRRCGLGRNLRRSCRCVSDSTRRLACTSQASCRIVRLSLAFVADGAQRQPYLARYRMPPVGAVSASVATSVGTQNHNVPWPKATLPGHGSLAGDGARIVPWRQPGDGQ